MGKVIMITSGKGGTGKSMFACNISITLAQMGKRVMLIDMDMGLRNIDLYLGVENRVVYDVKDVVMGRCAISQGIMQDKRFDNLFFMAASPEREEGHITPLHIKVLMDRLRKDYDYIIVDSPSGMDDGMVLASAGSDAAIIITNPEYSALRDADSVDRQLIKLGIAERFVVVNRVIADLINGGYCPDLMEVSRMVRAQLIGVIQQDENIHISTNLGVPIVIKSDSYICKNFQRIGERIVEYMEEGI